MTAYRDDAKMWEVTIWKDDSLTDGMCKEFDTVKEVIGFILGYLYINNQALYKIVYKGNIE